MHDENDSIQTPVEVPMAQQEADRALSRSEFWMRAALVLCGAWVLVIPFGVSLATGWADKLSRQNEQQNEQLAKLQGSLDGYVLRSETRLAIIEERQTRINERLASLELGAVGSSGGLPGNRARP